MPILTEIIKNEFVLIEEHLKDMVTQLKADEIVTVGIGGDYLSINEAINYVSKKYPNHLVGNLDNQVTVEISLLSGFVMEEEVHIAGMNLSWITITSIDSEVLVDESKITTMLPTEVPAAFYVEKGFLPTISALFYMSPTAVHKDGIVANDGGHASVSPTFGFKNAGRTNIYARRGSSINIEGGIATGAGSYGIYADYGSSINAIGADASDTVLRHCIRAQRASRISARTAIARNAGSTGVYARGGSVIDAEEVDASGAAEYGMQAIGGGVIHARLSNAQKDVSPSTSDFRVSEGGIISAVKATGGFSQQQNIVTGNGVIYTKTTPTFDNHFSLNNVSETYLGSGTQVGVLNDDEQLRIKFRVANINRAQMINVKFLGSIGRTAVAGRSGAIDKTFFLGIGASAFSDEQADTRLINQFVDSEIFFEHTGANGEIELVINHPATHTYSFNHWACELNSLGDINYLEFISMSKQAIS